MAKQLSERACPVDSIPLLGVHVIFQAVGKDTRVRDPKTGIMPPDERPLVPVCSKRCAEVVKETDADSINPDNFWTPDLSVNPNGAGGVNFLTK